MKCSLISSCLISARRDLFLSFISLFLTLSDCKDLRAITEIVTSSVTSSSGTLLPEGHLSAPSTCHVCVSTHLNFQAVGSLQSTFHLGYHCRAFSSFSKLLHQYFGPCCRAQSYLWKGVTFLILAASSPPFTFSYLQVFTVSNFEVQACTFEPQVPVEGSKMLLVLSGIMLFSEKS